MVTMSSDPSDPVQTLIHESVRLLKSNLGKEVVARIKPFIQQFPGHPRLHHLLGLALEQCGDSDAAIHHVSRAIALEPDEGESYQSLALLLRKKGKLSVALARAMDALERRPHDSDIHFLLGDLHMDRGAMEQAIASFTQAVTLQPEFLSAWINLGLCYKGQGQLVRARECFEQVLTIDPESALAHVNLALTWLLLGEYGRGFDAFEWRFRLPSGEHPPVPPPENIPRWHGESLQGKNILVIAEQGYGDTIQFVRFLPRLGSLGAKVHVMVPAPLESLLAQHLEMGQVQSTTRWEETLDYFIPMMSLGRFFARDLGRLAVFSCYLTADPEKSRYWQRRLPQDRLKVGLVWEGKPLHGNDPLRRRSVTPHDLAPLGQLPEEKVVFVSLQREVTQEQRPCFPQGMTVVDFGMDLHDFSDTAAVMANLDLMITIDTAAAHLAGAMGKPVWVLLPLAPDWRWSMDRDSSPWYPSSRLYRQTRINHWEDPIHQMVIDLRNRL